MEPSSRHDDRRTNARPGATRRADRARERRELRRDTRARRRAATGGGRRRRRVRRCRVRRGAGAARGDGELARGAAARGGGDCDARRPRAALRLRIPPRRVQPRRRVGGVRAIARHCARAPRPRACAERARDELGLLRGARACDGGGVPGGPRVEHLCEHRRRWCVGRRRRQRRRLAAPRDGAAGLDVPCRAAPLRTRVRVSAAAGASPLGRRRPRRRGG